MKEHDNTFVANPSFNVGYLQISMQGLSGPSNLRLFEYHSEQITILYSLVQYTKLFGNYVGSVLVTNNYNLAQYGNPRKGFCKCKKTNCKFCMLMDKQTVVVIFEIQDPVQVYVICCVATQRRTLGTIYKSRVYSGRFAASLSCESVQLRTRSLQPSVLVTLSICWAMSCCAFGIIGSWVAVIFGLRVPLSYLEWNIVLWNSNKVVHYTNRANT